MMTKLRSRASHRWLSGLMLLSSVLWIAACGTTPTKTGSSTAKGKFAVLSNNPSCTDYSFGEATCNGAAAAKQATGAQMTFAPNLSTADDLLHQGAAYANAGYKWVFIADGGVPDVTKQLASEFPHTFFCEGFTAISPKPKNLCTWNVDFELGTFSAGLLAGMLTKSNKVGGIEALSFPVINAELEAFILGARYVNPKVTSVETNINTSTDVSKGEAAANAQIAAGADMIISAADATNPGLYKAAEAHSGTLVFPQYTDSHVLAPSVVLTTALDDLSGCLEMVIKLAVGGSIRNQDYYCGASEGAGKLAPYTSQ
ncbi:MAG: BMP family ABC transporter substrate-binding protein, partial [Terriglobia bacterium]